jgi:hypothetical protein
MSARAEKEQRAESKKFKTSVLLALGFLPPGAWAQKKTMQQQNITPSFFMWLYNECLG